MKVRFLFYTLIAFLFQSHVFAQKAKDIREYKERANAVRQEVWNWDIPAFKKVPALPVDDKSSAIVIARHVDLKASSSRKIKYIGIGFKVQKDIFYSNTAREMIKLNDKAALDEYSQFSFKKFRSLNSYFHSGLSTTIVGVRIIKPDGTMKEVNVDEEIVNEEDGQQQRSKLAIPDLQVGDVIDYFVRVEELKDINSPIDAQTFVLGDDKPIMQYSVHCEVSDKYFVRYRTANGAPDFKVRRDDDGAVFDLLVKNIPSLPVDLWMSPYRQIPMVRMDILFGTRLEEGQKAGEIRHNPVPSEVKNVAAKKLAAEAQPVWLSSGSLKHGVKDLMKEYKSENGKIPEDSVAAYIYYAFRYLVFYKVTGDDKIMVGHERNYVVPDNRKFLQFLHEVFRGLDIRAEFVLVTSRYGPGQEELLNADDYEYMLRTQSGKPFFMCADGIFTNCNYVPAAYEGQNAPIVDLKNYGMFKGKKDVPVGVEVKLKETTANENMQIEQMKISLNEDMQAVNVNRHTILKGNLRQGEQKRLLLFEDYYEEERKALGSRKSVFEQLGNTRGKSTLPDEYKNAFAKARGEQKDYFNEEIKDQFDIAAKELQSFNIEKMGLHHTDPDFVYNTKFTLEGLVKRAGNNYILEAGKLIGGQLKVKPEQRDRKVDVYQPFARSFEYDIELAIPEGYSLEGADKLNRQVDNECGSFTVKAAVEANKLRLHIRKAYKNSFVPVAKWPNLLQVIDAASDFGNQKILFKKS
ncbi:DUF3857 domain-containing protein [Chitinophaga sp.]|uniref:DUF3857 domain-containing protein n=1 Tax=Chitinophaga sp. TaxID=1869181 RepID=UPI002C598129|nr:DUF3857 domain-containing protein [Chitinophaga sp.]HWV68377.1 DUF3857 domain-containing protein [Chitinophaga sp.]